MASSGPQDYRDLLRLLVYVRPYVAVLAVALGSSLLYSGGLSGRAYLVKPLLDEVAIPEAALGTSLEDLTDGSLGTLDVPDDDATRARILQNVRENFIEVLIYGISLILLMPLARVVRDYSSDWLVTRLHVDLQQRLGHKLLKLPLSHHQREGSGDFVARLGSDTMVARQAQTVVFSDAVQTLTTLFVSVGVLVFINWQLSLVALVVGPPMALVLRTFGERIRRSSRARQEQVSELTQRIVQILTGIKVIKAFHAETAEHQAFDRELMRYFRRAMRVVRNRVYSRSLVELVSQASFVSILLVGVYAIVNDLWGLTLGSLMAFITVSAVLYRPTKAISNVYNALQDALPAARRVFEILDAPETPADPPGARSLKRITRGICYEDVSFSYGRERVIEKLNLQIAVGEAVAIVGRTGAGKTTIADLLLRFHDPTSGVIRIDGIDIREIRRADLHSLISVVTQDPFLFDETILENIRYSRPDATFEEVVEAARAANVHEFIEQLPEGYETLVGEFGNQLSGGQRQRITIARAILCDPQVLIFDEATSSLDAKAERLVQEAIQNLMKGRTVLLIAHRLSTVKRADRIAIVEDHTLSMIGTHDELMRRGGLYKELVDLQLEP